MSSADFSAREAAGGRCCPPAPPLEVDTRGVGSAAARDHAACFAQYPDIYYDTAVLQASHETDYFVSSEGARVAAPNHVARLVVVARTRAADGMDLFRVETFEADSTGHLPDQAEVLAKTVAMAKNLDDLRDGADHRAVQRAGDSFRARGGGVLPRGAGASAGRPAAARR